MNTTPWVSGAGVLPCRLTPNVLAFKSETSKLFLGILVQWTCRFPSSKIKPPSSFGISNSHAAGQSEDQELGL